MMRRFKIFEELVDINPGKFFASIEDEKLRGHNARVSEYDLESLVYHLNETEGRLQQLHKQHAELATRYDEAQKTQFTLKLETEQAKTETDELRRHLDQTSAGKTENLQKSREWMSRATKSEQELTELRRSKERLERQNAEQKSRIDQLQMQSQDKQKHIESILDDLVAVNTQLDKNERQQERLANNLTQCEQKLKEASENRLISDTRLEKTQRELGDAEMARQSSEKRLSELHREYQDSLEQHKMEVSRLNGQIDDERTRSDQLLVQLERARNQSRVYNSQVEELRTQMEASLVNSTCHTELIRNSNDLVERQKRKLIELETTVDMLEADKRKLEKVQLKYERDKEESQHHLSRLKRDIANREDDLTSVNFQYNVLTDQLMELEEKKEISVAKQAGLLKRLKYEHAQTLSNLRNRERGLLVNANRRQLRFRQRLNSLRDTRRKLALQLSTRSGQMDRLNRLLLETGWEYAQAKEQMDSFYRSKVESRQPDITFVESTEQETTDTSHEQRMQSAAIAQESLHSILSWATMDLNELVSLICNISGLKDKGKTRRPRNWNSLNEWLLDFKTKIAWIRRQFRLNALIGPQRRTRLRNNLNRQSNQEQQSQRQMPINQAVETLTKRTEQLQLMLNCMGRETVTDICAPNGCPLVDRTKKLKASYERLANQLTAIGDELKTLRQARRWARKRDDA